MKIYQKNLKRGTSLIHVKFNVVRWFPILELSMDDQMNPTVTLSQPTYHIFEMTALKHVHLHDWSKTSVPKE